MLSFVLAAALASQSPELRLELVRESLTGTHCRYREYVEGIANEAYLTMPCGAAGSQPAEAFLRRAESPPLHLLLRDRTGRVFRRVINEEIAFKPYAEDYDAATGVLIRRVPLFFHAKPARVFDPNPVAALNDPSLQDQNDAASAVPSAAYRVVELQDVAESGPLRGPHVALVDRQLPEVAPPDAAGSLLFDRSESGFEDVNAYFHIDRTQRRLQFLGYRGTRAVAPYAIETDAHAAGGIDNSFFVASASQPGRGSLFFGEGGTDDAEDADLVVHEYGHAILEWISPGTFGGTAASESRALSEGFGDYWAFSAHYEQRVASGRDPFCFADWDPRCWNDDPGEQCAYPPGSDCLRRLDSPRTMADYESGGGSGSEHRNGAIWSSALREIFLAIGRDVSDTLVIESAFGAPPNPTFAVMARRLIDADRLLYNGIHGEAICAAMVPRGIVPAGACTLTPRGEWTHFQSNDRGLVIPDANPSGVASTLTITDTRAIEQIFVRVDIEHSSRGDLRIAVIAPDGTSALLQQVSFDRAPGVHATFGLDAAPVEPLEVFRSRSAAGVWRLQVTDLRLRDVGRLLSWGLVIKFAGDAPVSERPRGERTQMIPVVAHRHGANETFFASDVRLASVRATTQTATLIFTPSGASGLTDFAAVNVALAPGQTLAFDDVMQSLFQRSGSGSLEVLGDVIVMSRTYTRAEGGTVGQQVPPVRDSVTAGDPPLILTAPPLADHRVNFGLTELAGQVAFVTVFTGDVGQVVRIEPYSHVQMASGAAVRSIRAVSEGRIAAYYSVVDNISGDAMFIPAEASVPGGRTRVAPVADTAGVLGTMWQSDLWVSASPISRTFDITFRDALAVDATTRTFTTGEFAPRVLPSRFGRTGTFGTLVATIPENTLVATRIASGRTSQFVPFLDPDAPPEQHLVFIESSAAWRTNIGIVSTGAAVAEVVVYDAGGAERQRQTLFAANGIAQMAVTTAVVHGRATVRFLSGKGRAYASLIDNATADATLIEGQ